MVFTTTALMGAAGGLRLANAKTSKAAAAADFKGLSPPVIFNSPHHHISRNAVQKGNQRSTRGIEAPATFDKRQKNFLCDVLSHRDTPRHMQSETINRALPAPIERREGFFVAIQHPDQEFFIAFDHLLPVGRLRAASVMNSDLHFDKFH